MKALECPLCGALLLHPYELGKHVFQDHEWRFFEKKVVHGNGYVFQSSYSEDGERIIATLADEKLRKEMWDAWALELVRRIGT